MQRVAYWLIPAIALCVAIFLAFFLVQINEEAVVTPINKTSLQSDVSKKAPAAVTAAWMERFSTSEQLGYFYPVNEIYIKIDLDKKIVHETKYRLSASLLDPFQLFCLKQELNQHKLKYFLKKEKKGVELLIHSKNRDKLERLVDVLKDYEITATITPYKEVVDGKI